jgi:nitrite reductase (NADH) large subunit
MNIVIAGGGVAGITAAETARQEDPTAGITIFCQEREPLYYRPRLPEVIDGRLAVEKVYAHPGVWYQERALELRKGESLVEVDLESRSARGSLGSRLTFDRLLVATGADSSRPGPVDYSIPGVFTLRRLEEAMTLNYEAQRSKTAVILGGGILALEIGAALGAAGLKVHVLERSPRVLPRQTTPASSKIVARHLAEKGMVVHLGSALGKLSSGTRLKAVELSDGTPIEAQLLIVAAGVTPNLGLAKHLGLKTDRGVVVDQTLETSLENVYAAGDCAQTADGQGGLWSIARQQGLTAGRNLVRARSDREAYVPIPPSSVLKVAGLDLVAAGDLDPDDKLQSAVAEAGGAYRKVVVDKDGLVKGYTNVGTTKGNRELAGVLGKKRIPAGLLAELGNMDFDFDKLKAL